MKFLMKFKHAWDGLVIMWAGSSFKLQLFMAIVAACFGFIFKISNIEWIILILSISLVCVAETFNTAIEEMCDIFSHGWLLNEIKRVKDLSAGAVVIFALASIIIGLIIFIPKVF